MGRGCWGWVPQIGVRSSSRAVRGQPGSHPSALPQIAALLPHILCDELSQNSMPAVGRLLQTPVGWSIAAPQDVPSSQHSSRRSQRRILCHYHRVKPRETPKPANWRHLCVGGCAGSCGAGRSVPLCARRASPPAPAPRSALLHINKGCVSAGGGLQGCAPLGGTSAQKYFQDKQRKTSPGGGRSRWQRSSPFRGRNFGAPRAGVERWLL